MIKYIVETTSTWHKTNGYSSHFARITSTKTKHSLVIDGIGGESNAAALLFENDLVKDWGEVYKVQKWETPSDFKRMSKFANGFAWIDSKSGHDITGKVYPHTVTAAMIRKLNRK